MIGQVKLSVDVEGSPVTIKCKPMDRRKAGVSKVTGTKPFSIRWDLEWFTSVLKFETLGMRSPLQPPNLPKEVVLSDFLEGRGGWPYKHLLLQNRDCQKVLEGINFRIKSACTAFGLPSGKTISSPVSIFFAANRVFGVARSIKVRFVHPCSGPPGLFVALTQRGNVGSVVLKRERM